MTDFSQQVEGFTTRRSLGYLVRRAHRLMSQQAEQVFRGRDLTLSQWIVLKLIDEGRAETPGDAARLLQHNTGATTRLIDRLESQNLLYRTRETGDRRMVALALTPTGKRRATAWQGEMAEFFDELLAEFKQPEVETMIELMDRLVTRLETRDTS
jgi:DNA-binding MarR family transcriptional regulator